MCQPVQVWISETIDKTKICVIRGEITRLKYQVITVLSIWSQLQQKEA